MKPIVIRYLDRALALDVPEDLRADVAVFFALLLGSGEEAGRTVTVSEDAEGYFVLDAGEGPSAAMTRGEVLHRLTALVGDAFAAEESGAVLRAGAVGWGDKVILVAGYPGGGASSLVAWLVENGFSYLADDIVAIDTDGVSITGLPAPLSFRQDSLAHVAALPAFHEAPSAKAGERMAIAPHRTWLATGPTLPCGLIVYVEHRPGAPLALDPVPGKRARFRLLEATRSVVLPSDPAFAPVDALAGRVPAVSLTYGDYGQLTGVLDFLARMVVEAEAEPADVERFLSALPRPSQPAQPTTTAVRRYPIPAASERRLERPLTIGMATYDDYDGVYFSVQALRMYHPEVLDEVEILVVDNHPDGPASAALKALENAAPNYRYVPSGETSGTAIRDRVFAEAGGDFVLCMDCHVFVVPGALHRLIDYFAANPESRDLVQGPLIGDDLKGLSTHFEPKWREGMYGTWARNPVGDDPDAQPFEIPMQGLGVFACRRAAWPGFNPLFRGFGGEEGYIHEKIRQAGGRTLCLPFLRWMHRFQRPLGVPYPNRWEDRFRNYLIGFHELGLPTEELEAHLIEKMGESAGATLIAAVRRELAELAKEPADAL